MKTLDLSAYGVSEMTNQEMRETDGGSLLGAFLIGLGVGLAVGIIFAINSGNNDEAALDQI